MHYSDIVKWELRSVDRRAAQSVPNIFFKHKKLQMKQISDKVNLAVRRCKRKGKKITAEARNPEYRIFRQLTAKLLQQGYRYHKLRKTFSKFYRRHYELVSKFNVGLKTLLHQGLSEPEFYGDLVYKFKKNCR